MRRSAVRRNGVLAVVIAAVALLLTGCLRTELAVNIDGDGSGRVDLEVYFDELTLNESNLTTDDLAKLAETATQNIDGAEVSGVEAAGAKGIRLSLPFDDYHQLTQSLTNGEVQGMSTRLFQTFDIAEGDEGHWTMSASVDPVGFRSILSQIPAGLAGSTTQIDASTEFVFSVTLPGSVLRSNADSVDGGTARWNLKGDAGPQTFTMESEPSSLSTLQKVLIGTGALLVVGFLLIFFTAAGSKRHHRRKGRKIKVETNKPKDWAPVAAGSATLMPGEWSSPPPYSSHGWGEATPVGESPPVDADAPVASVAPAAAPVAAGLVAPPSASAPVVAPVADAPMSPPTAAAPVAVPVAPPMAAPETIPVGGTVAAPIAPAAVPDAGQRGPFSVDPTGAAPTSPPLPPTAEPPTTPLDPAQFAAALLASEAGSAPAGQVPAAPVAPVHAVSPVAVSPVAVSPDATATPVDPASSVPAAPVAPPVAAAPVTPAAPVAPPVVAAPPASTETWQQTASHDPNRVGPPVLAPGFVPNPTQSFPLTHGYSQPAAPFAPVAPAPYDPTAPGSGPAGSGVPVPPAGAQPTAGAPATPRGGVPAAPAVPLSTRADGRAGPPVLPAGFVPDAPIAFPDTHMGGPPPGSVPPPFDGTTPSWTNGSGDPDNPNGSGPDAVPPT